MLQTTHLPAHSFPFDDPEQSAGSAVGLAGAFLCLVSGSCLFFVSETYPIDSPSKKQIKCLATFFGQEHRLSFECPATQAAIARSWRFFIKLWEASAKQQQLIQSWSFVLTPVTEQKIASCSTGNLWRQSTDLAWRLKRRQQQPLQTEVLALSN